MRLMLKYKEWTQRPNTKTNSYLWNIPAFLPLLQPTHPPPCDFIAQFTCLFISPCPPSWLTGTCTRSVAADVWSPDPRKNELLYPLLALQVGNTKKFNWCLQVTEKVRRSKASYWVSDSLSFPTTSKNTLHLVG